jgi:indole-3-glycerol phosphate synthase
MPENVLERVVASVRRRLDATPPRPGLEQAARDAAGAGPRRSLRAALSADGPSVIAECKRASPSAGLLREPFDAVALARAYEAAGASAVSVVTEPDHFTGDPGWLPAVRSAVSLPVLRKDFVVEERQLYESVLLGADAVLLIQRLLPPARLEALLELAAALRLEVLLEVFADEDPAPAVASGCRVLGVNARDLATFEVRLDRVEELAAELPPDRVRVAESGIHDRADVLRLGRAGYDAFLVGEHLVRAADPGAALRELLGRTGE